MPPDADAREIDPRVLCAELLQSRNLVGEGVVAHVAVPEPLETGRAVRRAHAVDGNHDEPELRQRLIVITRRLETERTDRADLRTRVDVVDDRIAFVGIEVR